MSDWMDELERLAELRDKGLITQEQFDAERRRIVPSAPQLPNEDIPDEDTSGQDTTSKGTKESSSSFESSPFAGNDAENEITSFTQDQGLLKIREWRSAVPEEDKLKQKRAIGLVVLGCLVSAVLIMAFNVGEDDSYTYSSSMPGADVEICISDLYNEIFVPMNELERYAIATFNNAEEGNYLHPSALGRLAQKSGILFIHNFERPDKLSSPRFPCISGAKWGELGRSIGQLEATIERLPLLQRCNFSGAFAYCIEWFQRVINDLSDHTLRASDHICSTTAAKLYGGEPPYDSTTPFQVREDLDTLKADCRDLG